TAGTAETSHVRRSTPPVAPGRTQGSAGQERDELGVIARERERQAAFDQVDGVGAEDLAAPAAQDVDVALARGQPTELVGARDQAGGDAGLLGLETQQG